MRWGLGAGVAAAVLAADYVTKRMAEQALPLGEVQPLLPFFSLQRTANTGVAFGLLQGRVGAVLAATAVAVLVMLVFIKGERRPVLAGFAGGLLVAGTVGNAMDRVRQGYVTDFLKLPVWPNFNVADIGIVVGTGLLILGLVLSMVEAQKEEAQQEAARERQAGASPGPTTQPRAGSPGAESDRKATPGGKRA